MRRVLSFCVLLAAKAFSHTFYRRERRWVGEVPPHPWDGIRLIALLNHTSLFEWLFVSCAPLRLLWQIAGYGVLPTADVTTGRALVGRFFKALTPHVVSISREPDHTWDAVLEKLGPQSMVIILPEGRMMRANGLDKHGKPMTVRGGIADLLRLIPQGRMLVAYSGGLHHVQVPGQRFPRLFKTIRLNIEIVDIAEYRAELTQQGDEEDFRRRVKRDLAERRDRHCPVRQGTAGAAALPGPSSSPSPRE
ncbi:MAG: hypothetical protein ACRD2Z_14430 [Thermoanaerobaculia bacterium]